MTYFSWVGRHRRRDSPLGDLARDVLRDHQFPRDVSDRETLLDYLRSRRACWEALETARRSWATFTRAAEKRRRESERSRA